MKYTDNNGEEYYYAVFWTSLVNETDKSIKLKIHFPSDPFQVPSLTHKFFEILVPLDTMTLQKVPLFPYGLKDSEFFLDNNIHKQPSLKRTINSN